MDGVFKFLDCTASELEDNTAAPLAEQAKQSKFPENAAQAIQLMRSTLVLSPGLRGIGLPVVVHAGENTFSLVVERVKK